MQEKRFEGTGIPFNAAIPGVSVADYCEFSPEALETFKDVIDSNSLSTRSMDRLAKVARTVADLVGSEAVKRTHVHKAGSFVLGHVLQR